MPLFCECCLCESTGGVFKSDAADIDNNDRSHHHQARNMMRRRKVDQEGRALPKPAAVEFCIFWIPNYSKTFQRILFPDDLSMIDCSCCVPLHLQKTVECICHTYNISCPPLFPKQYHCISDTLMATNLWDFLTYLDWCCSSIILSKAYRLVIS